MQTRIAQLDAIRGIAILLVMLHNLHAFTSWPLSYLTVYGWAGVDLFFVLSGFLITGILLDTRKSERYFQNFYARRCLRIWPLYYALLVLMFVVLPLVRPQVAPEIFHKSSPWWAFPFFLQNFFVAVPTEAAGPLGVTWSLAVEELFYLVWPMFVRYLSPARLRWMAVCVILLSPALRLYLVTHQRIIYSNPICRLDGMMAGALIAMMARQENFQPNRLIKAMWAAMIIAVPLVLVSETHSMQWLTFSLTITASGAFVYLGLFSASKWLRVLLTNRFLMFTGVISYGLYLLHKLPEDFLKAMHRETNRSVAFLVAITCAYLLAILSWYLFEKPLLRLKTFFESGPGGMKKVRPSMSAFPLKSQKPSN